jgi:type II secretory pathway component PulJ
MSKRKHRGSTLIGLMLGMGLITIAVTGALKLLGISMSAQNGLNTESLVDQINRISEIVTVHLNRGGSFKNPDVEAKGIQLCSLPSSSKQCSTYTPSGGNFCMSIPTRVSIGGQDVINLTGFRLFNGVLAQREMNNVNMAPVQPPRVL